MAIECEPTFQQILINFTALAFGGLIGYLSASRISRLNDRRAAGNKLRVAFAPEMASMRLARTDKDLGGVEGLLREAFPRHAAAIEEYRFFVRPKDQAAYQQAWEEYYSIGGSVSFLDYYMGEKPDALFEQRVQAILRFTQR